MYIYVDKEAYEMLREIKKKLAAKTSVREEDITFSMTIRHLVNEYKKIKHDL